MEIDPKPDMAEEIQEVQEAQPVAPPVVQQPQVNDDETAISLGSYVTLSRHTSEVFMCSWNPIKTHLIATGSGDATARIWTMGGDTAAHGFSASVTLKHGEYLGDKNKDVTTLEWSPDGTKLATGSYDGVARVWDYLVPASVWDSKPMVRFEGHVDEVNAVKWDPSGNLLASCSDDGTAKIWAYEPNIIATKSDTTTGAKPIQDFTLHSKEIYTIKWSPTGPGSSNPDKPLMLATASFDNTVRLWNAKTGECVHTLARHTQPVYSISFSPSADYIASGSLAGKLYIWDANSGQVKSSFTGKGDIFEVAWNKEESRVAACYSSNAITLVDFEK
ncbi:hypothetical protein TL16_g09222 [Triparma laevis f. inornata]|uniref:Uncharacterized protein n=1 Tax=Triparma laevis f. inornata TaxID=1714386 RepID=A0A9W7EMA6_9STRA|nr:hypothetical protein TL16_g09222 [Triparma laevis f. inornata]